MNKRNRNRALYPEFWVGVFLLMFVLLVLVGETSALFFLLVLLALAAMRRRTGQSHNARARQFEQMRAARRSSARQVFIPQPRDAKGDTAYRHALRAVERAGLDPEVTQVLPIDVGVMAFTGPRRRNIYRTRAIPSEVDYLQPFVQLRLPTDAVGRIRFEITDSDGQALFIHEDHHALTPGDNLVTPSARLPIQASQATHGPWHLAVSADGVRLALHRFQWEARRQQAQVHQQISTDGELGFDARVFIAQDQQSQRLSLDELLADQTAAEPVESSTSRADRQERRS
ncbi:MAG: hypothetical protein GYB67_05830 [Chloroflexi bacterium]|nr:hypothetical protein [Chloroflexota bacterium]